MTAASASFLRRGRAPDGAEGESKLPARRPQIKMAEFCLPKSVLVALLCIPYTNEE